MELAVQLRDLGAVKSWDAGGRSGNLQEFLRLDGGVMSAFIMGHSGSNGASLARIYVGDEFCPHRLPTLQELLAFGAWAEDHRLPITLLTPVMTDGELQRCIPLVEGFYRGHPDAEVVVNDWGVLHSFRDRYPGLRLSAGRVFNKAFKDPRGTGPGKSPARSVSMREVLAYSTFQQPEFRRIMTELGVSRFERDLLPYETLERSDSPGFASSIYFPWGYVTTGRVCWVSSFRGKVSDRFLPPKACPKPCKDFSLSLTHGSCGLEIVQNGNTVYYHYSHEMLQGLLRATADSSVRLVYQPTLF